MTIIEAVARAICCAGKPCHMETVDQSMWECKMPCSAFASHEEARAAILATLKAIEEPSDAMKEISCQMLDECQSVEEVNMANIWKAMLSALIKQLEEQSK